MKSQPLTFLNKGEALTDETTYRLHRVKMIRSKQGRATLITYIENLGEVSGNYKIEAACSFNGIDSDFFTVKSSTALGSGASTTQQIKLHTSLYADNKFDEMADEIVFKITKVSGSTTLNYYGQLFFS